MTVEAMTPLGRSADKREFWSDFSSYHPADRNFVLIVLAAIWAGVLAGFVPDIFEHFTGKHVQYAPIVHFHAAVFLGWLVLLTTQMTLIRSGRVHLHRKLGLLGLAMIPVMLVLGPATALVMDHLEFGTPDGDAAFLIVPVTGVATFAPIALAGLVFRRSPAVHKRLMLLATVFLADAGFARWLAGPISKVTGHGVWPFFVQSFFGSILIMTGMVAYDLFTRRKLHPAFAIAVVFGLAAEVMQAVVYNLPAWKPIATHLIGH